MTGPVSKVQSSTVVYTATITMFFQGWNGLLRVIIVGTLAYFALVFLLRVSGKRTLSKMNAFDLVVTVALGSTLATVLLAKDVALAEGVTAFCLLATLQFIVTKTSMNSKFFKNLIKSEPSLLFFRGRFLDETLQKERVTEDEVRSAVRKEGIAAMEDVEAVVLETDGSLTVISSSQSNLPSSALKNVSHYPPDVG